MYHGDRTTAAVPTGLRPVCVRHCDGRLHRDGWGAHQGGDFQPAGDLVLEVHMARPTVERDGVGGPGTGGEPGAEAGDERVREPAAAVHLEREVEPLPLHAVEEPV